MPKRYNNAIHKLFLKSKTIKAILSSITRIGLIICIEDPKETLSINYIHIKDTKVEETTMADIITIIYPVKSNAIFIINLDTSQASI
jgi:transcription initiation factor IIE alpha subunit